VCEEALERSRHLDRLAARSASRKQHRLLGNRIEQRTLYIKQRAQDRAARLAEQARGAAHAPDSTTDADADMQLLATAIEHDMMLA
jgi:hypothetical protein